MWEAYHLTRDGDVKDPVAGDESHAEEEEERKQDHGQLALLGLLFVALSAHEEVWVVGKDVQSDIDAHQEDRQVT